MSLSELVNGNAIDRGKLTPFVELFCIVLQDEHKEYLLTEQCFALQKCPI